MAKIVVMEDDAGTRVLISSVLKHDGHEVWAAPNGVEGLALVESQIPDLIISDVQMPEMNGFEVLSVLRCNAKLSQTPVILLTSLQERTHMRQGMTSGADDYITKPFQPAELHEAVAAQLNKRATQANLQGMAVNAAVKAALTEQRENLARLYEQRLVAELSQRWPTGNGEAGDEKFSSATVLFVDIPNYAGVAEKLQPSELTDLVKKFYGSANDTAHLFGARHIQFVGEGLLAIFTNDTNTKTVNHSLRAARTALGLVDSGHRMRQYLKTSYAERQLPPFEVTVALHNGEVTLTNLQDPLHGTAAQLVPVGDAVGTTLALQRAGQRVQWPIIASVSMLRSVTGAVNAGRRALMELPGRSQPVDAAELTGLAL